MTDQNLTDLYKQLLDNYFPAKEYAISARFYPSKRAHHSVHLNYKTISFKISELFRQVPVEILNILGLILLGKLFRIRIDTQLKKKYKEYVDRHVAPHIPERRKSLSSKYTAIGKYYNLDLIFGDLNHTYFQNKLKKPVLAWSLNKSYRRLGFFDRDRDLLVISRIFDSRKVPPDVVRFLVYHEMLHIYFPVEKLNGRRRVHSRAFRENEVLYPDYENIQHWLKRKINTLKRF